LQNCPAGQALPQAPQLSGSLVTVAQTPAQFCWPTPQNTWHVPALHNVPAPQAAPQAPQWF
jgi:hypothetical protein